MIMKSRKMKEHLFFQDTMEFIRSFQSEAPLKRGVVSAQDASLQERVLAQVMHVSSRLLGNGNVFFLSLD